jgi:hypothetical protein
MCETLKFTLYAVTFCVTALLHVIFTNNPKKKLLQALKESAFGDFQLQPLLLRPLEHFPMQFTLNISSYVF